MGKDEPESCKDDEQRSNRPSRTPQLAIEEPNRPREKRTDREAATSQRKRWLTAGTWTQVPIGRYEALRIGAPEIS